MTEFTPGPWAWRGNTSNGASIYLASLTRNIPYVMGFQRRGMRSAQPVFATPNGMRPASDFYVYEVSYRKDIVDLSNPNARLIAAAPELYDAVVAALELHERHCDRVGATDDWERELHEKLCAARDKALVDCGDI